MQYPVSLSLFCSGPNGEFDISNKGRIGASEVELVQRMIDGVDKLIDMEESAEPTLHSRM
jgi:protein-arginine kinase